MNSLTSDNNKGELTTFEIKYINMLKDILNVTDERLNDHSIANSVRIAHKRSPNANESQIAKLAYNHLKRHKSDSRYAFKRDLEYEDERELILSVTERL